VQFALRNYGHGALRTAGQESAQGIRFRMGMNTKERTSNFWGQRPSRRTSLFEAPLWGASSAPRQSGFSPSDSTTWIRRLFGTAPFCSSFWCVQFALRNYGHGALRTAGQESAQGIRFRMGMNTKERTSNAAGQDGLASESRSCF